MQGVVCGQEEGIARPEQPERDMHGSLANNTTAAERKAGSTVQLKVRVGQCIGVIARQRVHQRQCPTHAARCPLPPT